MIRLVAFDRDVLHYDTSVGDPAAWFQRRVAPSKLSNT